MNTTKIWRITLAEKTTCRRSCIYHEAQTREEAEEYFNKNYNRFNNLVKITDITSTKIGRRMIGAIA